MNDDRSSLSWLMPILVWVTFFLYGVIAAPVPGVNEPHYLAKSRHYWQPTWCSRDFFLASPNAHTVFYATIGGLTNVLTLQQSAWVGRLIASGLLAFGWTHALSRILLTAWAPLWSAWIFLAISSCGNFSGEWLVGGVEGKVFSYAFLFLAFGEILRLRGRRAAIYAGLATSFHPIVGVWGVLAYIATWLTRLILIHRYERQMAMRISESPVNSVAANPTRSSSRRFDGRLSGAIDPVAVALLILISIPGLVPVIRLLMEPSPEATRFAATYIQVYFRLSHHLDPMLFPARAYWGYALLVAIWIPSFVWGGRTNAKRKFDRIVLWSVAFALAGIAVGWGNRPPVHMPYYYSRAQLLKFYPFRLADVLVPIAVAISLISVLERTLLNASRKTSSQYGLVRCSMLVILVAAFWRAHTTRDSNRYAMEDRADWIEVCHWIDRNLAPDALIQSPTNGWAFKWFAERAEYVAFKDCPQDAVGIVEWNRRLNFLKQWYEQNYSDGLYSANELRTLRRQTGLTHLLTDRLGPLELEPVYQNPTFQIYDLTSLDR